MAVVKKNVAIKNEINHLLGIQNISILQAKEILTQAKEFIKLNRSSSKKLDVLRGKTQINLFLNHLLGHKALLILRVKGLELT